MTDAIVFIMKLLAAKRIVNPHERLAFTEAKFAFTTAPAKWSFNLQKASAEPATLAEKP
ncbi:MAG: hypothetical protein ACOH2N_18780 [Devosia sp.]